MDTPLEHLLIVDDDREIRSLLAERLTESGYRVTAVADGVEMRKVLHKSVVDMIVLDINLPREDGLSLCRELRSRPICPLVIMLTARAESIDRIVGLELGADDYLTKPFEPRELLARIKNVLRRAQALPTNLEHLPAKRARFAGWVLDLQRRRLETPDGRTLILSGSEYRLLLAFIDHANRVLGREQLLALVSNRGGGKALDRAIDLRVSRLRQKLGPETGKLIRTVRNEGYVLTAPVDFE